MPPGLAVIGCMEIGPPVKDKERPQEARVSSLTSREILLPAPKYFQNFFGIEVSPAVPALEHAVRVQRGPGKAEQRTDMPTPSSRYLAFCNASIVGALSVAMATPVGNGGSLLQSRPHGKRGEHGRNSSFDQHTRRTVSQPQAEGTGDIQYTSMRSCRA